jgi:cell shape-determining protein MreD
MRWTVFLIMAFLALAVDHSFTRVLTVSSETMEIRPSITPALAVFVALAAPRMAALWACLLLGLLVDLPFQNTSTVSGAGALVVVGPYALGYVFGGYFICQLRASVFRRRALTIGVLAACLAMAAATVAISCGVIRSWHPASWYAGAPLTWPRGSAGGELLRQLLCSLASGLVAIPVGWMLIRTVPLWGFQHLTRGRGWR